MGRPRKYEWFIYDHILNCWSEGISAPAIARDLTERDWSMDKNFVDNVIRDARKRGDPKAIYGSKNKRRCQHIQ